jgi:alpha-tubulin suppressor-like RCC1 family protein
MGERHACGIQADESLWCWGANERGQLGLGRSGITRGSSTPMLVDAITGYDLVTAGLAHTCVRSSLGGVIMCWGDGSRGQLGTGNRGDRDYVWPIRGSLHLEAIDAGDRHTCGISPSGFLICWGANESGQLATGDTVDRAEPTIASLRSPWILVSAGARHTCGIDGAGALYCWGEGADGQLGTGDTERRAQPTRVCWSE